ncbi:hypothetical protein [Dokdonella ginsengisoli]|uniref:Anti-sigma factor n=1 Tax=Dokdonella ginsengisoli TaxID=363846 RepID=A0ABV9QV66_9GAMM
MSEPGDETLRAWLLHRLPDEASAALEERLLLDEAFGVRLRAVETDLFDDYARGLLDPAQRAAVERWLLATPADRERLRAERALSAAASARPASPTAAPARRMRRRRTAWLGFASAAALLLALCLPLRQSGVQRPAAPSIAAVQTITLLADLSRSAGDATGIAVRLPAANAAVRLQAETASVEPASPATPARYVLRIRAPARDVFEAHGLVARTEGAYRFVEATLPPATLAAGDYRVSLAAEGDGAAAQEWTLHVRAE